MSEIRNDIPFDGEEVTPTRILVIRFSSIGDIVLCTPVLRALKTQLDGPVEIHFITKAVYASLLQNNPNVDRVITIKDSVAEVRNELRSVAYDYVIDLHHNARSWQVKRIVKGLSFTVKKRNLAKWLYVQTKRLILPIGHIVERNYQCVAPLGIEDDAAGLEFYLPGSERVSLNALPELFRTGYAAYAIGGLTRGKVLPHEKAVQLLHRINRPIVLLGGKEDAERGDALVRSVGENVYNACGKFNLNGSASLIEQSEVVVTHDTGLMHIASALCKRVVSMWFATTPQLGFAPWRPAEGSEMLEANCSKRPTAKLGNRGYEDGCVFNIDLDRVAALVNG